MAGKRKKYYKYAFYIIVQKKILIMKNDEMMLVTYYLNQFIGNLFSKYKGIQVIGRAKYSKAIYVHFAAHTLFLAVSNASNIQPIRN
jgi:hypothetical protein